MTQKLYKRILPINLHIYCTKVLSRLTLVNLAVALLVVTLTACFGGISDWSYEQLPNEYRIIRVNSDDIIFEKDGGSLEQTIDRYITEFCYNEAFIGIKRIPMDHIPYNELLEDEDFDYLRLEYYLIDAMNDTKYGPYNEDEYIRQCSNLSTGEMCEWISTEQNPNNIK